MKKAALFLLLLLGVVLPAMAQYTRQDTLRGSNGSGRSWWDVTKYDLQVSFDTAKRTISGTNYISFTVTGMPTDSMQIDLQDGMFLDDARLTLPVAGDPQEFARMRFIPAKDGNVFWVSMPFFKNWKPGSKHQIQVSYHGRPREAVKPPWDGGFIWTKDSLGNPWTAVACQGLGASVWWPCKDYQGDEPDSGMVMHYDMSASTLVGNGRKITTHVIISVDPLTGDTMHTTEEVQSPAWYVKNPINSYDATFYIGDYVHWHDTLMGEKGILDLDFYALRYHEQQAREQFKVVKQMIHCFEYWMGPYPFYEDGYKLVEAPYLGMEHQSAIAYGNKYQMGYLGYDRSGTGVGLMFDYIIVHESGHEWFGNNITAKDEADNWLHEGFTTYTESLFAECIAGKDKAAQYTKGEWHQQIDNDAPIIGPYGVNKEGSGDMYDKGAAILYMIRQQMGDDEKFRQLLRGLNKEFYHSTVTSAQVEGYISQFAGKDFGPFFNQYLRTKDVPLLSVAEGKKTVRFRFFNTVPGFTLPINFSKKDTLYPTGEWQEIPKKKWNKNWQTAAGEYYIKVGSEAVE